MRTHNENTQIECFVCRSVGTKRRQKEEEAKREKNGSNRILLLYCAQRDENKKERMIVNNNHCTNVIYILNRRKIKHLIIVDYVYRMKSK